jgi:S1-C subfamily serine protease
MFCRLMGMVSIVCVIIICSDGLTQKSSSEDQPTIDSVSFKCVEDLKILEQPSNKEDGAIKKDAAIKLFREQFSLVSNKEADNLEIKGLIDEIKNNPIDPSVYGKLGESSLNSPNIYSYTIASCAYRVAVILEPNNADFLFGLGKATWLDRTNSDPSSRFKDSIRFYERSASLLEQDKKSFATSIVDVYAKLAYAYEKLSEVTKSPILLETAIGYYDKAISYSDEPNKKRYLNLKDEVTNTSQIKSGGIGVSSPLPSYSEEPLLDYLRATVLIYTQIYTQKDCQQNRQDDKTRCAEPKGRGVGSGWVFKREGKKLLIATNNHVINSDSTPDPEISVEFYGKSPYKDRAAYPAKLRKSEKDLDLAVLEVENAPDDIKPLAFYEGKYIPRLTTVTIIGNPPILLGYGDNMADYGEWTTILGSVTNTINSNAGSCSPYLPIDGLALPGNSGGPVLNEKNQVIGMITRIDSGSDDSRLVVVALTGCSIKKQLELWKFLP